MTHSTDALRKWCSLVEVSPSGCWLWRGYLVKGYARFRLNGKSVSAARFAYQTLVRPMRDEEHIDHLCHTFSDDECAVPCIHRSCVNPQHLDAVSQLENNRRAWDRRKRLTL